MKYYIICAQPRGGTTLLRRLLVQQKNCGNPLELFNHLTLEGRIPTLDKFYEDGTLGDVCGATVHRHHWEKGIKNLKKLSGIPGDTDDLHVLNTLLPDLHFIYYYRQNKVKQAVSFLKMKRSRRLSRESPEFREYSENKITDFLRYLCRCEAQWLSFFEQYGVRPHVLTYEDLCLDMETSVCGILEFLKLDSSRIKIDEKHLPKRGYDEISEDWYQRYINGKK